VSVGEIFIKKKNNIYLFILSAEIAGGQNKLSAK